MNNAGKVLLGFIAGAAAGAIAGILMAPDSGDNTRQKISDRSNKFKENINERLQQGMDKVNSLTESAVSLMNSYKSQMEGKAQDITQNENSH